MAGRVIVVDAHGRVLMLRGEDPGDPDRGGFWFTPGGGVEGAESPGEAARRELREEIGLEVGDLGDAVMERFDTFPLDGVWYEQSETIYLVEAPAGFEPAPPDPDRPDVATLTEVRWWSLQQLRDLEEVHYPRRLVDLVEHVRLHGRPDPPWREVIGGP